MPLIKLMLYCIVRYGELFFKMDPTIRTSGLDVPLEVLHVASHVMTNLVKLTEKSVRMFVATFASTIIKPSFASTIIKPWWALYSHKNTFLW